LTKLASCQTKYELSGAPLSLAVFRECGPQVMKRLTEAKYLKGICYGVGKVKEVEKNH
jgi:hypothetical protein